MANPTSFEWSLLDRLGNVARTQAFIAYDGDTETVDALLGTWLATGALLDACTGSQIIGGQVLIPLQPGGSWKSSPAADDFTNGDQLILNFANASNRYASPIAIPGYLDSFLVSGKVNLAATALAALITDIVKSTGTAFYNSRDLHPLADVRDAFPTTRKQRGQRSRARTLG